MGEEEIGKNEKPYKNLYMISFTINEEYIDTCGVEEEDIISAIKEFLDKFEGASDEILQIKLVVWKPKIIRKP